MGIFNTGAPPLSDLSLILQAIIFSFLALAVYARLKHSYMKHAILMGSGIVLHTVTIVTIMVPSLLSMEHDGVHLLTNLTDFALLTIAHAAIGSLVELLGVWLVATWLFNTAGVEKCFRRRNVMRVTIALWLTELILGIYVYMMLYLPA
jgi:uncharacterized membrane protein YozB (DUF420 family)